ncbi:hypothetical protein [Lactobacillus kefiranofaciens]|uniref:Uncharacterized protein n=1 Tax=Lactobacillus kefiranofaciens TaxID=267818 RepID=A0AAX3UCI8_9LACO|nr:hypothetical protein [Lactobacillus kefiranofaciens]AEG41142.1 hypothetical protein WANG_1447 [Lactobacillus kefiranofaciens subsp. kefiranofaciens]KRM21708.1 hypothetical protein FC93_GL000369 [Lactobacillus kefiranofaciens subsp. kefiranofaciens DSM 5016 = JCM 6985]QFQ67024.1 hypothetical protein LKK75_00135 [Lactobacillus kefiranofaciens subsp. kefiranofaciens]WGO85409.1 hypothetical protein QEJ78_08560 [Lactobacillus kefiranofaciens]WQH35313.1 hypothetical protein U2870_06890 [Lactobaci
MNNHLVEIDGKYPWGVSPLEFGTITLIWKIMILIWWLFSSLAGHGSFTISLLVAFIPEMVLALYEFHRNNKYGWIIAPVNNTMRTARLIEESRPLYRTLFGYNKIVRAPIFYLDSWKRGAYLLTFEPNGCPNANVDILLILQQELPKFEIIPTGSIRKQYIVRKRRKRGKLVSNADFY